MLKNPATYFLSLVQQSGKSPNFWMSEEYIHLSDLVWEVKEENYQGFVDDKRDWYFPSFSSIGLKFAEWKGFQVGFQNETIGKFWDHEFIYDPNNFLNLSGSKWKVFRKNIKKHQDKPWEYRRIRKNSIDEEDVIKLFLEWADGKNLYDPETFTRFVIHGENRFGLFLNGVLKGVNIADVNFNYINYRICFDNGEPFLNEFLRYKFYTSEWVLNQNKYVNDGGSLGSYGLCRFKNKLNPVAIMNVYTGVKDED